MVGWATIAVPPQGLGCEPSSHTFPQDNSPAPLSITDLTASAANQEFMLS